MATPARITLPTEPIGSIPRPTDLIERVAKADSEDPYLAPLYKNAIRDTMKRFEGMGSVDPILGPRKKCATVRSNPARIGAAAREAGNF
jgi:5-methyltetrahydropteroyltriglutamate--homocysteine methyltransferase